MVVVVVVLTARAECTVVGPGASQECGRGSMELREPDSPTTSPAVEAAKTDMPEVLQSPVPPTPLAPLVARKEPQLPKGTIVLETGLRSFNFVDRAGRTIPVHYYISGDFTVGDLDLGGSNRSGDEDDACEEEAEGENDSQAGDDDGTDDGIDHAVENDEDEFEDDFFRDFEEHEELMLSQTMLFVCHGVLRNAESYCRNWITYVSIPRCFLHLTPTDV
jgi:hypothetical protein